MVCPIGEHETGYRILHPLARPGNPENDIDDCKEEYADILRKVRLPYALHRVHERRPEHQKVRPLADFIGGKHKPFRRLHDIVHEPVDITQRQAGHPEGIENDCHGSVAVQDHTNQPSDYSDHDNHIVKSNYERRTTHYRVFLLIFLMYTQRRVAQIPSANASMPIMT